MVNFMILLELVFYIRFIVKWKKKLKIIYFYKKIYSLDLFYLVVFVVFKVIYINCYFVINFLK